MRAVQDGADAASAPLQPLESQSGCAPAQTDDAVAALLPEAAPEQPPSGCAQARTAEHPKPGEDSGRGRSLVIVGELVIS